MRRFLSIWGGPIAFLIGVIVVITFVVATVKAGDKSYETHLREFKSQCVNQGGKAITLDESTYCMIHGTKITY